MTIPPISAAVDSVTGNCTFTLTNATATFKNKPKNALAVESPFNDIILQTLDVAYRWDDLAATPAATGGLGGSVPANGSSTAQFAVVSATDLSAGNRAGHTASLALTFRGTTVSGDDVETTTGGTLQVNSCATTPVGACCLLSGACNVVSQQTCVSNAGSYQGDNISCLTVTCN